MPSDESRVSIDASPAERIAEAVALSNEREVADRAAALLAGANEGEEFLLVVGGRHAQGVLDGAPALYWPELWGARALLYVWDDSATAAVTAGLHNQAWRVREMCAKVVAERALPLAKELEPLLIDEVARVRASAARALGAVGEHEHGSAVKHLVRDPDIDVRRRAGEALKALASRTGRPIE